MRACSTRAAQPPRGAPVATAGSAKALFVADCGSCHRLRAPRTRGTAGPSLDRAFRRTTRTTDPPHRSARHQARGRGDAGGHPDRPPTPRASPRTSPASAAAAEYPRLARSRATPRASMTGDVPGDGADDIPGNDEELRPVRPTRHSSGPSLTMAASTLERPSEPGWVSRRPVSLVPPSHWSAREIKTFVATTAVSAGCRDSRRGAGPRAGALVVAGRTYGLRGSDSNQGHHDSGGGAPRSSLGCAPQFRKPSLTAASHRFAMARPGLEPGTPRFSGVGVCAAIARVSGAFAEGLGPDVSVDSG